MGERKEGRFVVGVAVGRIVEGREVGTVSGRGNKETSVKATRFGTGERSINRGNKCEAARSKMAIMREIKITH